MAADDVGLLRSNDIRVVVEIILLISFLKVGKFDTMLDVELVHHDSSLDRHDLFSFFMSVNLQVAHLFLTLEVHLYLL